MMKTIFKFLGAGVAVMATVAGSGFAYMYFRSPAIAPPSPVRVEMTAARIARGKYIFKLADCDGCHSPRDFTRFDGPVVESSRGQGLVFPKELGLPGMVASRNITTHPAAGIGSWTDGEKIRAIREGISRDGTMLFPMMPYVNYKNMSDEDVYSLVAYLNTLAPVNNMVPRSRIDFPVSMLVKGVPQPAGTVAQPDRRDAVKYGAYLVTIGGCSGCHTQSKDGEPLPGLDFAGGEKFQMPGGLLVVSANITPDMESGIGRMSEQNFVDRFQQYKEYATGVSPKVEPRDFTVMPWLNFALLPEQDLKAIYAYLRTQKPIYLAVDSHPGTEDGGGSK